MSITNTTAGADLAEIDEGLQHVEQHTEPDEQDGHDAADADSAPVAKDTAATATGAGGPEQFVMPNDAPIHPLYPIGHRGDVDPAW